MKDESNVKMLSEDRVLNLLNKFISFLLKLNHLQFIDASLNFGRLGLSGLMFQHWKLTTEDFYFNKATEILNEVIKHVEEGTEVSLDEIIDFSIYIELCSQNKLLDIDPNTILSSLDKTLFDILRQYLERGNLDVMNGGLRIGHYFLLRYKSRKEVDEYLEYLVKAIKNNCIASPKGIYWRSHLNNFKNVYLGYHGSASFIIFLEKLYRCGIMPNQCLQIIEEACLLIVSNYLPSEVNRFPVVMNSSKCVSILELTYSDLLPAYSLLLAGKLLNRRDYIKIGENSLIHSAHLIDQEGSFRDYGIAYGLSGASIIYINASQLSECLSERRLENMLIDKILSKKYFSDNHDLVYKGIDHTRGYSSDLGLMTGIIGIASTLSRYLNPDFSFTDRTLFIN